MSQGVTHTPGPWTAWDDDGTGTTPCVLSEKVNARGNFYICETISYADARLIAAAPELLEAVKRLQVRVFMYEGSDNEEYRMASAAIAKAMGAV